jgi:hypothetical protein
MVKSALFPSIPDVDQLFLKLKKWRTPHRISKNLTVLCLCPHTFKPKVNFLTDAIPVENGEEQMFSHSHGLCSYSKFSKEFLVQISVHS